MNTNRSTFATERAKLIAFLVGVIILVLVLGIVSCGAEAPSVREAARPPEPSPIPYTEVQSWPIERRNPSSGELFSIGRGRVIVIDSVYRTEDALRRLGDQFHRDSLSDERQTLFEVYTDSLSAARRQRGIVGKLPRAQQQRYDVNLVGNYTRNRFTGYESWTFGLNGLAGDSVIEVKY